MLCMDVWCVTTSLIDHSHHTLVILSQLNHHRMYMPNPEKAALFCCIYFLLTFNSMSKLLPIVENKIDPDCKMEIFNVDVLPKK
jgi:hypothetical protein